MAIARVAARQPNMHGAAIKPPKNARGLAKRIWMCAIAFAAQGAVAIACCLPFSMAPVLAYHLEPCRVVISLMNSQARSSSL